MGIMEPLPPVMDDCLSYDLGQHDNLLYVSHYVSSEGYGRSAPMCRFVNLRRLSRVFATYTHKGGR